VTSDKCYENREWVWGYRENDPMGGYDPYSSSKGCAELATAAYRQSFFNPERYNQHKVALSSIRAGNVIGGGDWGQDRLLPDCVRALSQDKPILIRNPNATRPWQHVLEPLSGYLLLGARMYEDGACYGDAWNFGPSDTEVLTVEEVVKRVIKYWGSGSMTVSPSLNASDSPALHEANWLKLDCSKALTLLNWRPRLSIDQALKETVEWYKLYYRGADKEEIYQKTESQIIKYMDLAEDQY
jgi:CDP-glucose 4,6-dehydratase